jgi:hypothetical protein
VCEADPPILDAFSAAADVGRPVADLAGFEEVAFAE